MTRRFRCALLMWLAALCFTPTRASAQPTDDDWKVDVYPLYFWAMSLNGDVTVRSATLPVDLAFSDAAENLGGAFSFHFEASKGRWGTLADLNFIRLSTDADFTVAGRPVAGDFELDNVMFEAGASYLAHERSALAIIGGLRTYTVSPKVAFTAADGGGATPVDDSVTSANAFVGMTVRPRLSEKWTFLGRADVGGGDANLTWSAEAGLDFRFKPWGSVAFGYKGLGIDVEYDDKVVRTYDVVHHGPFFALGLHWGGR
jgi:hypothetical protein